ncbi:hypothetical protein JCM1840_007171 [Sporobolomyces johnsonii]
MDDLSGARSKKWNPHYAIQFTNAALPRSIRHEESAIRVFTVGHGAKPLELAEGLADTLNNAFSTPVEMTDTASHDKKVLGGHPRCVQETLRTLDEQLEAAKDDKATHVQQIQTRTGIVNQITQECCTILLEANDKFNGKHLPAGPLRRAAKLKPAQKKTELNALATSLAPNSHNPLLDLARAPLFFNVHRQTASDLLHGFPLGPLKYLVKATKAVLSRSSKDKLAVRLEAASTAALGCGSTLNAAYMLRHLDSLNGVEMRLLLQVMACALAPIKDDGAEDGVEAVLFEACDIALYGPPKGFAVDRHEAFNSIIRNGSVYSNRSAPSKDIGGRMSRQEVLVHLLDGGRIVDDSGTAKSMGPDALKVIKGSRKVQALFGLGGTDKLYGKASTLSHPSKGTVELAYADLAPDLMLDADTTLTVKIYNQLHTRYDTIKTGTFVNYSLKAHELEVHQYGFGQSILCMLNVSHNCVKSGCTICGDAGPIRQERETLSITKPAPVCAETSDYILNSSLL